MQLKLKRNKKAAKKPPKITNSIVNLIPIKDYDNDREYFIYKNDSIMNIMQFVCKDLTTTNTQDIEYDIMQLTKFLRMYADDCKIISINIPTDCRSQIDYFTKKIEHCKNEIYKKHLTKKLNEEIWIEKNRLDKEFYLMVFAKTPEQYAENKKIISQSLQRYGLLKPIERSKKIAVLYKLANINMRN